LSDEQKRILHSKPGQRFGGSQPGFCSFTDRRDFLETISRVCPEFFRTLREAVLPLFPVGVPYGLLRSGDYHRPILEPIREAFEVWTKRFNIQNVTWLHRVALQTVRAWKVNPTLNSFQIGSDADFVPEDRFQFVRERDMETLNAFLARIEKTVRAYYAEINGQVSPINLNPLHAEWLVRFQLMGQSPAFILRTSSVSTRAPRTKDDTAGSLIQKGYEKAAAHLGIPLRPSKRGKSRAASK
jgi:hypothetical protein